MKIADIIRRGVSCGGSAEYAELLVKEAEKVSLGERIRSAQEAFSRHVEGLKQPTAWGCEKESGGESEIFERVKR